MRCLTYILVLVLVLGMNSVVHAQKVPSKGLVKQLKNEDEAIELLKRADRIYKQNPDKALELLERSLYFSLAEERPLLQADCYTVIGKINSHLGQHDLAIHKYEQALDKYGPSKAKSEEREGRKVAPISTSVSRPYQALYPIDEIKWLQAQALHKEKHYDEALALYQELEKKAVAQNNTERSGKIWTKMAQLYQEKGQPKKAAEYSGKVIRSEPEMVQQEASYEAEIVYSQSNLSLGNKDLADGVIERAKEQISTDSLADFETQFNTRQGLANYYNTTGESDKEIELREENIKYFDSVGMEDVVLEEKVKLSDAYLDVGAEDEALSTLSYGWIASPDSALPLDKQIKIQRNVAQAYSQKGETENAVKAYQKWADLNDSLSISGIAANSASNGTFTENSTFDRLQRIESIENEIRINQQTILLLQQAQDLREQEIFNQRIIIISLVGGLLLLSLAFYRINRESQKKRRANQMLALKSLRSQMNPHFIFNALNSVNGYISRSEERKANKYLSEFSRLMRLVLENSKQELVPLKDELELLELYLKLEHARFEDRFTYSLEVDPELLPEDYDIPPMLVQPFVENAVWHGLRYLENEPGTLQVYFSRAGKNLKVIIEDNGIGRKKSVEIKTSNQRKSQSTGLRNTENRIKLINRLYETDYHIQIEDIYPEKEHTGTRVSLIIPAKNNAHA